MKKYLICLVLMSVVFISGCKNCNVKSDDIVASEANIDTKVEIAPEYLTSCSSQSIGKKQMTLSIEVITLDYANGIYYEKTPAYDSFYTPNFDNETTPALHLQQVVKIPQTGAFTVRITISALTCMSCCTKPNSSCANQGGGGYPVFVDSKIYYPADPRPTTINVKPIMKPGCI